MNSLSLLGTIGLLSALPFARGEQSQPFRLAISAEEQIVLEERIDTAVRAATGLSALKGLAVDWAGMRCLPAGQEFYPDLGLGVCVVKASAFQLHAEAAVLRSTKGPAAQLLFANVE